MSKPQQPSTNGLASHLARPRSARHIPSFEERIQQQALEQFRREQRATRGRKPRHTRLMSEPMRVAGPSAHPNGYPCPELSRPAGVTPERFAAFALPSRVGDWLHYPDGRKERLPGK